MGTCDSGGPQQGHGSAFTSALLVAMKQFSFKQSLLRSLNNFEASKALGNKPFPTDPIDSMSDVDFCYKQGNYMMMVSGSVS